MSSNMPSKFMDSFCTSSRKKRQRYFGHDPDKNVPVTVDLSAQREEISRVPMQDLNHEEDKILHLIVKFGLNQVLKLYSILQTIPKNFPNRLKYFVRISKFITGLDMVPENIVHKVGTILDESNLPLCNVEDVLWSASHGLKMPVVVFLSPKADTCIIEGCDGTLYGAEKEVTNVTLFTMTGPVPGKTALSASDEILGPRLPSCQRKPTPPSSQGNAKRASSSSDEILGPRLPSCQKKSTPLASQGNAKTSSSSSDEILGPRLQSCQKKSTPLFRVKQTEKKKEVTHVAKKTTREKVLPRFWNKTILQVFEVEGKQKEYKGWVKDVVRGKDGWKSAVYQVEYEDGEVLEIPLFEDFVKGEIKIL